MVFFFYGQYESSTVPFPLLLWLLGSPCSDLQSGFWEREQDLMDKLLRLSHRVSPLYRPFLFLLTFRNPSVPCSVFYDVVVLQDTPKQVWINAEQKRIHEGYMDWKTKEQPAVT